MRHRNLAEKNRDRKPVESGRISIKAHPEVQYLPVRSLAELVRNALSPGSLLYD